MSSNSRSIDTVDLIRCWAIFFMMYAHYRIDSLETFQSIEQFDGALYQALHYGMSRTASAFLGITSGYFFYQQICRYEFIIAIKKRFNSLVMPTVYWSIIFLFFTSTAYLIVYNKLPPVFSDSPWRLLNQIVPIQYRPANFPLHYLTDLFKLCLVTPILLILIRRLPPIGKFLLLILLALIPNSVSDSANVGNVLPRWDLVVFFIAGLTIASEGLNLVELARRRISLSLVVSSLVVVLTLAPFWQQSIGSPVFINQYAGYLMVMTVKAAGILLFVGVAQRCVSSPIVARLTPRRQIVFTAFCLHAIVLYFLSNIASRVGGFLLAPDGVSFVAFLFFPFIAFGCAIALTRLNKFLLRHARREK